MSLMVGASQRDAPAAVSSSPDALVTRRRATPCCADSSVSFCRKKDNTGKANKDSKGGSRESGKDAELALAMSNLKQVVVLPEGEDVNEWLAVNTVDFFNQTNMIYGTLTDFCTPEKCSVMSAGPKYEYHWADGAQVKKAIKVSAPEYVEYLMNWVQGQLDDESLFPSKSGVPFPKTFQAAVKNIFKRLFRVYAHIYHSHASKVSALGIETYLQTSFRHFILFVNEFQLIEKKELAPLEELIATIDQS